MTLEELEKEAQEALKDTGDVVLCIPRGGFPRSFPRGKFLAEEEIGGKVFRIYRFDAKKVLNWIKKVRAEAGMNKDGGN